MPKWSFLTFSLPPFNSLTRWSDFAEPRFFWKPICSYNQRKFKICDFCIFRFSPRVQKRRKFQKNYPFQKYKSHISIESSWRADSKNAIFFDQKLILAEILAMKGSKKCKIWHFFCPPKCISGNGRIWTNLDFSESLCVDLKKLAKIEAIYPYFVFSQRSKNGQKFKKNLFFSKN